MCLNPLALTLEDHTHLDIRLRQILMSSQGDQGSHHLFIGREHAQIIVDIAGTSIERPHLRVQGPYSRPHSVIVLLTPVLVLLCKGSGPLQTLSHGLGQVGQSLFIQDTEKLVVQALLLNLSGRQLNTAEQLVLVFADQRHFFNLQNPGCMNHIHCTLKLLVRPHDLNKIHG